MEAGAPSKTGAHELGYSHIAVAIVERGITGAGFLGGYPMRTGEQVPQNFFTWRENNMRNKASFSSG